MEELERDIGLSVLHPQTEGTQFLITAIRYVEFTDRKIVMISLNDDCGISVYLEDARYSSRHFSEENRRQIGGKTCWIMEVENGVQAVMEENDLYYVFSAPDMERLSLLISITK